MLKNHWDAIGALGQWFAGIGTVVAVIVAIWQTRWQIRPHVSVMSEVGLILDSETNGISRGVTTFAAINAGSVPVTINKFYILFPKRNVVRYRWIGSEGTTLPRKLNPSDEFSIVGDLERYRYFGVKHDTVVAMDNRGRVYRQKVGAVQAIKRALWWQFGVVNDWSNVRK